MSTNKQLPERWIKKSSVFIILSLIILSILGVCLYYAPSAIVKLGAGLSTPSVSAPSVSTPSVSTPSVSTSSVSAPSEILNRSSVWTNQDGTWKNVLTSGTYYWKNQDGKWVYVPMLEYDINLQIPIEGLEQYKNINQDKYGKVDTIEAAKGELLVRLADGAPLYEIAKIAKQYNMDILRRYRKNYPSFRLRLSSLSKIPTTTFNASIIDKSDGTLENIWRQLDKDLRIFSVGLNDVVYQTYWPNDPEMKPNGWSEYGVKPEFSWIGADDAWQNLKDFGLPPGGDGENIWVAVIDNGVDLDHPDLTDNIATDESGKFIGKYLGDPCEEGKYNEPCKDWIELGGTSGGDGIDNDGKDGIDEAVDHGTDVAGIVAEVGDNNIGAAGVAFNTKIISVNVFPLDGDHGCQKENMIAGIDFAVSQPKVRILNLSIGSYTTTPEEKDIFDKIWNNGKGKIIAVAGVGNNNIEKEDYPAAYKNVIAVASVRPESNYEKSSFSNFGPWVDISTYGEEIFTTSYNNDYASPYANYIKEAFKGTSAAAPLVSGSIALLLSKYPNFSNQDVRDITIQSANFFKENDPTMGCGVVNTGFMLLGHPPILTGPKNPKTKDLICKNRFYLGQDITLSWKASPTISATPDEYFLFYGWGDEGWYDDPDQVKIGQGQLVGKVSLVKTTLLLLHHQDIEAMGDGNWYWRIGARYGAKTYWTQHQMIRKETSTKITTPPRDPGDYGKPIKVGPGTKFEWDPIQNAKNYFVAVRVPASSDIMYRFPLNSNATSTTLTEANYKNLQTLTYGGKLSFSLCVTGTNYENVKIDGPELTKVKYGFPCEAFSLE